ncbi:S26 family signal peptidase [Sphingobium sp. AS12]|uniref:S26 family signal peptidase n=1 Tax=Sphingobium sp. AS12 TaxID=2849495 RepID=UPI001C312732|nr:S26 family signal peptidase [Sphingobium sp. AS12]
MTGRNARGADAPLLAWGDALRAAKLRRKRLGRRIAIGATGAAILLASAAFPPTPRLVWNASASAPIGLYSVAPKSLAEPGDMVIARVPETFRRLAGTRRYLPTNVPLVKRVAAAAGDEVCALGQEIFVNGHWIAERRVTDGAGRAMPMWSGCVRLRGRQLFLLMDAAASFDGRYFGVTEGTDVVGKARLLWAR